MDVSKESGEIMRENDYRHFLEGVIHKGVRLTNNGINTRISLAKKAEEILGDDLETIVSTSGNVLDALYRLIPYDHNGNLANAVRKYYEMRHGYRFPKLNKAKMPLLKKSGGVASFDTGTVLFHQDVADIGFSNILKRYRNWLVEVAGLGKNTADSYKTYLKKLCVAVDKSFGVGWFESLLTICGKPECEDRLTTVARYIEENLANAKRPQLKDWRDWRSAFYQFENFLDTDFNCLNEFLRSFVKPEIKGVKKVKAKPYKEKNGPSHKSLVEDATAIIAQKDHKKLISMFLSRLNTQGRYYPGFGFLFPTRLLNKIFHSASPNSWRDWLVDDLESMRVLLGSGDKQCVQFSDVRTMTFHVGGKVDVILNNGEKFPLYTRTATGGFREEEAQHGSRDISIDHVQPLERVLRENCEELKGLRIITELFHRFNEQCGGTLVHRNEYTWCNHFFDRYATILDTAEMRALLKDDLNRLNLQFELMDSRENILKSNN